MIWHIFHFAKNYIKDSHNKQAFTDACKSIHKMFLFQDILIDKIVIPIIRIFFLLLSKLLGKYFLIVQLSWSRVDQSIICLFNFNKILFGVTRIWMAFLCQTIVAFFYLLWCSIWLKVESSVVGEWEAQVFYQDSHQKINSILEIQPIMKIL